jgi:hypothetical protein
MTPAIPRLGDSRGRGIVDTDGYEMNRQLSAIRGESLNHPIQGLSVSVSSCTVIAHFAIGEVRADVLFALAVAQAILLLALLAIKVRDAWTMRPFPPDA